MTPHHYVPDATVAADHRDERPCALCPLPRANAVHDVPDLTDQTAESRRRAGDQDQED